MSEKHTPTKWEWTKLGDHYRLIELSGYRQVVIGAVKHPFMGYPMPAMTNAEGILTPVDPSHPNARLIAAAPELLEALEWIEHHALQDGCPKESLKAVAREAIRKAKGDV